MGYLWEVGLPTDEGGDLRGGAYLSRVSWNSFPCKFFLKLVEIEKRILKMEGKIMSATCCSGGCPVCDSYNSRMARYHVMTILSVAKQEEEREATKNKNKSDADDEN
ncbi:hypothetical protein ACFLZC_02350 [Patescibacteria group bacterium]